MTRWIPCPCRSITRHSPTFNNYVNNKIVPEFEKITTVTDVSISGGQKEYIQVQLIPEKLEQYHLNLSSVATAIGRRRLYLSGR